MASIRALPEPETSVTIGILLDMVANKATQFAEILDAWKTGLRARTGAQPLAAAPVDAVAATNTVTSDNTNITTADTVQVSTKVYTFRTALTPLEGEVLRGADADASLTNLSRAINHTGTPDTDYKCAAAHPTVSSSAVAAHALTLSARTKGTAGNFLSLAVGAAHLTRGAATFAGGIDGTVGAAGDIGFYGSDMFFCNADATIATAGAWKKATLGVL